MTDWEVLQLTGHEPDESRCRVISTLKEISVEHLARKARQHKENEEFERKLGHILCEMAKLEAPGSSQGPIGLKEAENIQLGEDQAIKDADKLDGISGFNIKATPLVCAPSIGKETTQSLEKVRDQLRSACLAPISLLIASSVLLFVPGLLLNSLQESSNVVPRIIRGVLTVQIAVIVFQLTIVDSTFCWLKYVNLSEAKSSSLFWSSWGVRMGIGIIVQPCLYSVLFPLWFAAIAEFGITTAVLGSLALCFAFVLHLFSLGCFLDLSDV